MRGALFILSHFVLWRLVAVVTSGASDDKSAPRMGKTDRGGVCVASLDPILAENGRRLGWMGIVLLFQVVLWVSGKYTVIHFVLF